MLVFWVIGAIMALSAVIALHRNPVLLAGLGTAAAILGPYYLLNGA